MAKNLKLNIKNSQLAEALKLNKVKKTPASTSDEHSKKASKGEEKLFSEEENAPVVAKKPSEETTSTPQKHEEDTYVAPSKAKEEKSFREEAKEFETKRDSQETKKNNYPFDRPFIVRESRQTPAAFRQFKETEEKTDGQEASAPRERFSDRPSYPSRPSGDRPSYQASDRSNDERRPPSGDRPPYQGGDRRPSGDRPAYQGGERRSFGDKPSYQGRPSGDRPAYQNRGQGDRPPYQGGERRPSGDRPSYQGRPSGDRPPYQNRASGDRPPYQGGERRPSGDRPPYQGRPSGDRPPYQNRASGDRPPYQPRQGTGGDRSQGGYSGPRSPGGSSGAGRPGMPPRQDNLSRQKMEFQSHRAFSALGGADEVKTKPREDKKPTAFKEFRDVKTTRKVETKKSFDARDRHGLRDSSEDTWRKKRPSYKGKEDRQEEVVRPKQLKIRLPITVKDLASEMKLKASQLIAKLFMQGVVITLNDYLDDETTVQLLGHEFECDIQIDTSQEKRVQVSDKTAKQEIIETDAEKLILRSPVITFMGHVDHGKTSLIDYIRKSDVAAKEAGAITQHIGAFKVHTKIGDVTIIDTPGHEAFSAMRSRGAVVTDIVVLVVAGDEGIKAQTEEAIRQAQEANVKIVVAINKSDRPNFNEETVLRQLSEHNLLAESWGGETITVKCSAVTGEGINELLEMLSLQSEVLELRANPNTRARGTILESEMHKGLGCVATLLIQNGTLRLGDAIVFDQEYGKVKTMQDEYGKNLKDAGPSSPVKITGLSALPPAGSDFIVVKDEKEARIIAEARQEGERRLLLKQPKSLGLEAFLAKNQESQGKKILNLIIRADVQGSVEALKTSLMKIKSSKVDLNIISAEVGEISESDIQLAQASKATILGFHTQIESHAEVLIKQTKIQVKLHDIIYHAVDEIKKCMLQLLDKVAEEKDTGSAEVLAVFKSSQLGLICGCIAQEGTIHRNNQVRQIRDKKVIWKGSIASIKRVKDDVREVNKGLECGILLQNNNDIKVGDILQAYEVVYLDQEL